MYLMCLLIKVSLTHFEFLFKYDLQESSNTPTKDFTFKIEMKFIRFIN